MSDNITDNNLSMEDFIEYEKSLRLPRSGELVTGTVHSVSDKEIIVNLGLKKTGHSLRRNLLKGTQAYGRTREGDEIDAKVLKTDDGDGTILLSRKKLEASEHWKEINQAYEDKSLIEVEVVKRSQRRSDRCLQRSIRFHSSFPAVRQIRRRFFGISRTDSDSKSFKSR